MVNLGFFAQDISILHRQYYKDTSASFAKIGINPTAACILLDVYQQPKVNQQEISAKLVIDKALIARELNKLQKLGLIEKVPGKGRSLEIELTSAGKKMVNIVQKIRSDWVEKLFADSGIDHNSPILRAVSDLVEFLINK
ncbi:MarR family winged helix-turn-helix transcriptional regulator [Oenococcus alcoholitolerans]|uniref:MarR family winged helix-turn-helix transcriptional regulator n=1 Tax=Oenococcus alcoholitolerans TaxID=931074 RepID=UPI003F6FA414